MAEANGSIVENAADQGDTQNGGTEKLEAAVFPTPIPKGDDSTGSYPGKHEGCKAHNDSQPLTERECYELARDFVKRFSKGFLSGVGMYAGVRIVTALLRNPFRKSIPVIWRDVMSRDCAAVAGFLGLYPSVYHLLVDLLIRVRGCKDGWNYGIAGGVGGLSIAVLDTSRRQTLAFFTLSRAMGAGISTLVTRGYLRNIPYFEVGVFSACVSLIVYCTALAPHLLNRGYYRSILKWSRDYTDARLTRLFREPGPRFLTCAEVGLHEGSCTAHRLKDLLLSLSGFAKLYLPIHLTPVLIFKRGLLLKRPLFVLTSLVKNLALSTAFLGLMVTLAKLTICLLRNAFHRPPPLPGFVPAVAGAVCGLALLLERFNRRKELTLFVIPHFLNILYVAGQDSAGVQPLLGLPHGFTLTFALSMSSVMHAYEREPQSLTLLINGILKFFFGPSSRSMEASSSSKDSPSHKSKLDSRDDGKDPNPGRDTCGTSTSSAATSRGSDSNKRTFLSPRIRFEDMIKILH
ncbi:hypothetical protein ElyMa_001496500 [Elysia marginata]|uniref:Transmembrane protein 135 N-terminal domain-containing protein n=1 Tax=Elysia marginata TaxID=1093978 RepID=A0AAV4J4U4_9GAST|nr:hypothetical protein ElyMa_001496500 [Elysia marginata]